MNVIKSGSLLPVVHSSVILKHAYPEEIVDARKVTLSDASLVMMLVVTGGTSRRHNNILETDGGQRANADQCVRGVALTNLVSTFPATCSVLPPSDATHHQRGKLRGVRIQKTVRVQNPLRAKTWGCWIWHCQFFTSIIRQLFGSSFATDMELTTLAWPLNSTSAAGVLLQQASTDGAHFKGAAVSAVISEAVVRNIYILIGTLGFVGNLFVIFIITCFTNMTDKVGQRHQQVK
jgi:hypothetical protein